jgi:hypothetical protein
MCATGEEERNAINSPVRPHRFIAVGRVTSRPAAWKRLKFIAGQMRDDEARPRFLVAETATRRAWVKAPTEREADEACAPDAHPNRSLRAADGQLVFSRETPPSNTRLQPTHETRSVCFVTFFLSILHTHLRTHCFGPAKQPSLLPF